MTHVNIGNQYPAAYQALMELNNQVATAATDSGLEPKLVELVKIRASQLNGCAFCLKLHTQDAIKHGESADRLAVVRPGGSRSTSPSRNGPPCSSPSRSPS